MPPCRSLGVSTADAVDTRLAYRLRLQGSSCRARHMACSFAAMNCSIMIPDKPTLEHREAVRGLLADFNAQHGYPVDTKPVAVLLNDEQGRTIGGLWGQTSLQWLYIEFLFVPENLRGRDFGSALMDEAERVARKRGCANSWLTTFSFQARTFYEKRGYEWFGELDNSPGENVRFFLRKRLEDVSVLIKRL